MYVFEEFMGMPAHPLLVHTAVVLVPLQVLTAFAYALVPLVRRFIAWLVVALAVVAPAAALFAKLSGEALRERMTSRGTAGDAMLAGIDQHNSFGNLTTITSAALSVLMVALLVVQLARGRSGGRDPETGASRPGTGSTLLAVLLTVGVLGAGGAAGYYVFKSGDSGAKMVWTGL